MQPDTFHNYRRPSRLELEFLQLREQFQRTQHRVETLSAHLELARTANKSLVDDYVGATNREQDLLKDLSAAQERDVCAQVEQRIANDKLASAMHQNEAYIDLLSNGARVVDKLEERHAFELSLACEGVPMDTIMKARQPWVEKDAETFVLDAKAAANQRPKKIILAYDANKSNPYQGATSASTSTSARGNMGSTASLGTIEEKPKRTQPQADNWSRLP